MKNLPDLAYAGIFIQEKNFHSGYTDTHGFSYLEHEYTNEDSILTWLHEYQEKNHVKFVAIGIAGEGNFNTLISRLWLEEDIVTLRFDAITKDIGEAIEEMTKKVATFFDELGIAKIVLGDNREVIPSTLVSLDEYKKTTTPEEFDQLLNTVKEFEGKKLSFFSATPRGGGVALMRHALIRLYRLLDVDAHWYVMEDRAEAFEITKKRFHNVLQAVSEPGIYLREEDKVTYNNWIKENVNDFIEVFKASDVIIIDDPQPSGMVPYIKEINPKAKIIYRSHIQIEASLADDPTTIQYITWSFIWNNIKSIDCFVSHPIEGFIPSNVPKEKVVFSPATTDPLDGLNKPLQPLQTDYYFELFNKILATDGQTPLDRQRDYIIQIARFDPSKGIPDVVESYVILRNRLEKEGKSVPQLVIAGHGAVDDPEGMPIFNATKELLMQDTFKESHLDIKVARLPHVDELLNTLIRGSKIVLQLSHKEGFEIKVSEGLMKGKPVIAYKAGGIPLQIEDTITGFIVDVGRKDLVAQHMYNLLQDRERYEMMSMNAKKYFRKDILTIPNAIRWLYLANHSVHHEQINAPHLISQFQKKKS